MSKKIISIKDFDVFVFDMDGTLYELDGENGAYSDSTLQRKVIVKAAKLIQAKEELSEVEAMERIKKLLSEGKRLSLYFKEIYDISPAEYFDTVWNHKAEEIVRGAEVPVSVVRNLKNKNKKIYLLTAAPKVWQEKVTEYLELGDCFDDFFTAEDFEDKLMGFKKIAEENRGLRIISIGDQLKTDINPAVSLGIEGMLINSPQDLKFIL